MIHARQDYNRIQDPANLIGKDEPVFLVRAQDELAPNVVLLWCDLADKNGVDPGMVQLAREHAQRMVIWQIDNGCKSPDMPGIINMELEDKGNAENITFTGVDADKPPLGIMPLWQHQEKRMKEIEAAIDRYHAANIEVPATWLAELAKLRMALSESLPEAEALELISHELFQEPFEPNTPFHQSVVRHAYEKRSRITSDIRTIGEIAYGKPLKY